jgi:hypothetical protein
MKEENEESDVGKKNRRVDVASFIFFLLLFVF